MALSAKLELRQGQQLVMTPQLQQAIRLLQLSNIELNQFVEAELERNPLLERDEDEDQPAIQSLEPQSGGGGAAGEDSTDNGAESEAWIDLAKPSGEAVANLDTDYDNDFSGNGPSDRLGAPQDGGWASLRTRAGSFDDEEANLESFVSNDISLKDHLSEQLSLAIEDPVERLVGQYLVDQVDEAGYLISDLPALADKLGAPVELVDRVLTRLQTFDPAGVFARSLAECLALQLKEQNRYDPQIAILLDNLHLLASHNLTALKKAVGADMDEITDMIEEIKRLNPKPGLKFG